MAIWNERIHEKRIEKGITLAQIADKLGVTEATAQRYECGSIKNIPYDYICAYGEILNCSPAYLMGWEDLTPHYESFDDIEYIQNIIQSLDCEAYITSSDKTGNSLIVQKNGRDESIEICNSELHNILARIEKAKSDIILQTIDEKYANKDFYKYPSEEEAIQKAFGPITTVKEAKEYLSLRRMNIAAFTTGEKISDEAIINIANVLRSEKH